MEFILLDRVVFETKVDNIHVDPVSGYYYTAGNDLLIEFIKTSELYRQKESDQYKHSKCSGSVYQFKENGSNGS